MAKYEIKRTKSMRTFLLSHETVFTRDLESLMESEERLRERTQEISRILSTFVLMADVTYKLLIEAEEAFYSFTRLMPNEIVKVISRYGIGLNQDQTIRPKSPQLLGKLKFNLIKTKRVKAKFLKNQTVQIGNQYTEQ